MNYEIFSSLAKVILEQKARKATKFLGEKEVVKATRKLFRGRIDKRSRITEIHFTAGAPNFEERKFIRAAKAAGEPFPVKKVQVQWPKKG